MLRRRSPAYLEIDKLPAGQYRATIGTLFEHQENLPNQLREPLSKLC
jgi:hypothetical protein